MAGQKIDLMVVISTAAIFLLVVTTTRTVAQSGEITQNKECTEKIDNAKFLVETILEQFKEDPNATIKLVIDELSKSPDQQTLIDISDSIRKCLPNFKNDEELQKCVDEIQKVVKFYVKTRDEIKDKGLNEKIVKDNVDFFNGINQPLRQACKLPLS
ncbi:unnamed protein product [Amaranthus hypochondriacus]